MARLLEAFLKRVGGVEYGYEAGGVEHGVWDKGMGVGRANWEARVWSRKEKAGRGRTLDEDTPRRKSGDGNSI